MRQDQREGHETVERRQERGSTGLTGVHFDRDDAIASRTLPSEPTRMTRPGLSFAIAVLDWRGAPLPRAIDVVS
jgi:hypothetical protein